MGGWNKKNKEPIAGSWHHSRVVSVISTRNRDNVLLFCAFSSVVVDFANFLMQRLFGGTGELIGACKALILLMLIALVFARKSSWIFLLGFMTLGILRLLSNLLHGNEVYSTDYIFLFRFLLTVAFMLSFRELTKIGMNRWLRISYWILFVQSAVIIVAFSFKIHFFDAYEFREGYKGLFVHINDEAFMMAGGLLLSLERLYLLKMKAWGVLGVLLLLGMSIMGLGSRTALLGALAVPIVYLGITTMHKPLHPSKSLFAISTTLSIAVIACAAAYWNTIQKSIISQLIVLYVRSGSILNAVTTGLDVYIREFVDGLDGISRYLFGGFVDMATHPSQMLESDIFDIFFRFGILAFPLGVGLAIMLYGKSMQNRESGIWSMLVLIILIGGFTGHVLISSQNSMWVAFFLTYFCRRSLADPKQLPSQ